MIGRGDSAWVGGSDDDNNDDDDDDDNDAYDDDDRDKTRCQLRMKQIVPVTGGASCVQPSWAKRLEKEGSL